MPTPDDPSDTLELRPADWSDVQALTAMLDAASQHWLGRPTTAAQVSDRINTPDTDISRDTRCVVDAVGTILGFGHLWPTHPAVIRCFARTHPDHRGRGVGMALQGWARARSAELAACRFGEVPRILSTTSWPRDKDAEGVLAASGYEAVRYYLVMAIQLSPDAPSPVPTPDGVVLRTFRDEDAEGLYEAYLESFAEHWGFEHPTPSEWWGERRESAASGFDPGLWHIATSRSEIAGFSVTRTQADSEGLTHGYVGDLGVRPAWRGRGLGEALLTRSLQTFRGRGLPYATLDVDAENTSGALRLYTKIGMETRPSFTIWEQPLSG